MNERQEKSIKLIEEYLESIDDEEFLTEYLFCEDGIGPLAESFVIEGYDE